MLAFIDCFLEEAVYSCVNNFVEYSNIPCTYHQVSTQGIDSLKNLSKPTGYIILGSYAHVTDNYPWQIELNHFIEEKLKAGFPVLGICYGHQAIAYHFGCKIDWIQKDQEILKCIRKLSFRKETFISTKTIQLAYTHAQYISKLSDQFEELAASESLPNEIIKHKSLPFWGVQAHPEASLKLISQLTHNELEKTAVRNDGLELLVSFYQEIVLKGLQNQI